MNAVSFRKQQQQQNKVSRNHKPAVTNNTINERSARHFTRKSNDELLNDKKILTVDDVIYSSFDKKKSPRDKKSILFKSNGEQRDKDGDLIPNRKNKKALKKYLKDEIKRINMLDE